MQLTMYNARMLRAIIEELASWESGGRGISEIQPLIESTATLLERDGSGAAELLRSAAAELESIRFTRIDAEQRIAAVARMSRLRADLHMLCARADESTNGEEGATDGA